MSKSKIILKTENLCKSYKLDGETIKALDDINIEIKQGEFLSIVGKSGSGKSTLMHLIGLLDTPTTGKIYLNNQDVSNLSESSLAKVRNKEIGFVFQSFNLLQRTKTIDNVILPLKYGNTPQNQWKQKAMEMIEIVKLQDRVNNKSNELSGGQRQRVAIARALVNDPSIILADEPTGNLDTKTGAEILKLFQELNKQGKTIVIVTHDTELAKKTARQIVISDGKIIK